MSRVLGILLMAASVLAVIYVYNRFSGKSVSDLGKPSAGAV